MEKKNYRQEIADYFIKGLEEYRNEVREDVEIIKEQSQKEEEIRKEKDVTLCQLGTKLENKKQELTFSFSNDKEMEF